MATADVECPPPLEFGDNLTREQFLRLWELNPAIKRAELIGGVVYMPSPVSIAHGDTDIDLGGWTFIYKVATPGLACGSNATTILSEDVAQPEVNLRVLPEYGGKTWIKGKYLAGPPEFLGAVCASSAAYDLHQKLDLYESAGVQEYLTVLVYDKEIRWHVLENGKYQILPPSADGISALAGLPGTLAGWCRVFPGRYAGVLDVLQKGIESSEHAAFVQSLATKKDALRS